MVGGDEKCSPVGFRARRPPSAAAEGISPCQRTHRGGCTHTTISTTTSIRQKTRPLGSHMPTGFGCLFASLEGLEQCARVRGRRVIFVEVFRLLLVIAGTIGGLTVGNDIGRNTTAPVVGISLGALASYLIGGIIGRMIDRGLRDGVNQL